ncbi:MAG: DUF1636 family protein [Salinarimonas sp.]
MLDDDQIESAQEACLSVCMRCKPPEWTGPDAERPGQRLAQAIAARLRDQSAGSDAQPVRLRRIRCMSQCKRACVVAFSGAGRFTYLFGDLDPARDAEAVLEAFGLYRSRPDGFMERPERPEVMRAGILGRIPPLDPGPRLVESDAVIAGPGFDPHCVEDGK